MKEPSPTTRSLTKRQRRSLAIHEAGHAVIAIALGRRFRSVTIMSDGNTLGHVRITPPRHVSKLQDHFDFLQRSLAGYLAEREFGFRPRWASWSADRGYAVDHAFDMAGSAQEANLWIRLAELQARGRVRFWRPAIEAVAERLLSDSTLNWQTARDVAHKAMLAAPVQ